MDKNIINSDEYIKSVVSGLNNETASANQLNILLISTKIGLQSLFNGKKWIIFILMSLLPVLLAIITKDPLFGNNTAKFAFIDFFFGFFFLLLYSFGALLISLPISVDENSDHVADLYLVRPIKREIYWASRWMAVNLGLFTINAIVVTFYYLFFYILKDLNHFFTDLPLLFNAYIFLIPASLIYAGLFLLVGNISDKGFTLGILLAIIEPFFLSLLFLSESKYIPRNNLMRIGKSIFGSNFKIVEDTFSNLPSISIINAWIYVILFSAIVFTIGALYIRKREYR